MAHSFSHYVQGCSHRSLSTLPPSFSVMSAAGLSRLLCVMLGKTLCREDRHMGLKGEVHLWLWLHSSCDYKLPPQSPLSAAPSCELHLHHSSPFFFSPRVGDGFQLLLVPRFLSVICLPLQFFIPLQSLVEVFSFEPSEQILVLSKTLSDSLSNLKYIYEHTCYYFSK